MPLLKNNNNLCIAGGQLHREREGSVQELRAERGARHLHPCALSQEPLHPVFCFFLWSNCFDQLTIIVVKYSLIVLGAL